MGYARWNPADWSRYSRSSVRGRSRRELFFRRSIEPDFDPLNIRLRESRDSERNPESTAIIIAFDETGSMGAIPEAFVRAGLATLVEEILARKPVPDPHVMIMGFGDAWCDDAPLQVTQFEADLRIAEQLQRIYLEGGGGGNAFESYNLPWYFAARRTALDCFEKRGQRGYLFTVGDEPPPPVLLAQHVQRVFGDAVPDDLASADVLAMASRMYHVFHVVVEQGSFYRSAPDLVLDPWRELLGQRVLPLADYTRLAEVIVAAMEVSGGTGAVDVASSPATSRDLVVSNAVAGLKRLLGPNGIVRF
ncbi:MAG: hypothetical protein AAF458_10185 [Pseudomonadota bacterium]